MTIGTEARPKVFRHFVAVMVWPQINGDAVDAIVVPEARKILRAHVNDSLVPGVIVKDRSDPKWPRTIRGRERDHVAFPQSVPPCETFRHEHAWLVVKTAHELGTIAVQELKL